MSFPLAKLRLRTTQIREMLLSMRDGLVEAVPVISAPMGVAAPAALATAVTDAGGLGLIGGGYGHEHNLEEAFREAGHNRVGIGFITWSLAKQPGLLEQALKHRPRAFMLSFGDPAPFAPAIKAAGVPLICQCQNLQHVKEAIAAGADVVVAQGSEAGGHGAVRGTVSFVAEVADHLKMCSPHTLLVAAGGIADGRGLAAALMLGADGVLMGSRFWASKEAAVPQSFIDAAIVADGDATLRTSIPDIARRYDWPQPFNIRTLHNRLIQEWLPRESEARANADTSQELARLYADAVKSEDPHHAAVIIGEAVGLIQDRPSAGELVERIAAEASQQLSGGSRFVQASL